MGILPSRPRHQRVAGRPLTIHSSRAHIRAAPECTPSAIFALSHRPAAGRLNSGVRCHQNFSMEIKNMRLLFVSLTAATLLASCSSGAPLSESECRTMADKEAAHMSSMIGNHPNLKQSRVASELPNSFQRIADMGVPQCVAGKSFQRSDYECVMGADDQSEVGECLTAAHRRS